MNDIKAIVFNISRYAVHDGPGIRTTVFLKGCPLNCPWCHNPEGINPKPEIMFLQNRCIDCRDCVKVCGKAAISKNGIFEVDYTKCDLCGDCVEACCSGALEIAGNEMFVEEIMEIIERDIPFYEQSGGGVTFSGGEPAMQHEFLYRMLEKCRNRGINTALDTSGYIKPEIMTGLAETADLILYDIKMMNPEKHKELTGVSNELILKNLKMLAEDGAEIIARLPLIPSVNDSAEEIEAICRFIKDNTNITQMNILPFHQIGREKFRRLGIEYKFGGVEEPPELKIKEISNIIRDYDIEVFIGG